jgi:hypothetical protein
LSQKVLGAALALLARTIWCGVRSILRAIVDCSAFGARDLEVVQNSTTDEVLKRTIINKLRERHRERRAPYAQHLATLQEQMLVMAA